MPLSIRHGLVYLLAAAGCANAAAIHRRGEIDCDAVIGFQETVPDCATGELYQKFKPFLKVDSGCVPFPAVDAEGNTNAGLDASDTSNSGCSSSPGQVYVRGAQVNSSYALMYSWYMPKDAPPGGLGSHRHDWEGCVVWLSNSTSPAKLLGVAASAHGGFNGKTDPALADGTTRPLIKYYNKLYFNHEMGFTGDVGSEQPMVAWECLPDAAREALQNTDFGDASVPFKDGNFEKDLGKAAL